MRDGGGAIPYRNRLLNSKPDFPSRIGNHSLSGLGRILRVLFLVIVFTDLSVQAGSQAVSTPEASSKVKQQDLPDAPSAAGATSTPELHQSHNSTFASRFNQSLQPMNTEEKLKYFLERPFGPRAFFTAALNSGIRMAKPPDNYPREWRSGAEAYGRFYGDSFARKGAQEIGRASASILFHEDPRYRRSESSSSAGRLAHALIFTFVDRTDGGHATLALSNFTGAAAGGFIGNAYLPCGFDNLTHAGQRSTGAFTGLAMQNVGEEFAPDFARFLRKVHLPHVPLPPVWWTKSN